MRGRKGSERLRDSNDGARTHKMKINQKIREKMMRMGQGRARTKAQRGVGCTKGAEGRTKGKIKGKK